MFFSEWEFLEGENLSVSALHFQFSEQCMAHRKQTVNVSEVNDHMVNWMNELIYEPINDKDHEEPKCFLGACFSTGILFAYLYISLDPSTILWIYLVIPIHIL